MRARSTAAEILQRLADTYIGPDVVFPNMPDPPPGFVTRITPERLGGVGPVEPAPALTTTAATAAARPRGTKVSRLPVAR